MKPLLSDQELKQATVRDYKRWAERAGQSVDANELEKQAVADLQLADNYDAGRTSVTPKKPDPERQRAQRESLAEQAAESGAEIVGSQERVVTRRFASLHAKSVPGSRWSYAMGRLARILERPPIPSRRPWEDCQIPKLAKEVYRLKAFIELDPMRRMEKVGDEVNPFYGLSDKDFERKFRRLIENICDRSTGRLGQWYFKR